MNKANLDGLNRAIREATGMSPQEALTGRKPRNENEVVGIRLDQDDVTLELLAKRYCESCEQDYATHTIQYDIRTMGVSHTNGAYCEQCGKGALARIKASLPPPSDEQ